MLTKQNLNINFSSGLDTKTDPWQVGDGKFLALQNSIFTKGGLLQKRNGYAALTPLPNLSATYLTTFSGNLTAIDDSLLAYSQSNATWLNKGNIQPLSLNVLPVGRSALNQTQCDSVIAPNGLVCTVFTEVNNSTADYKYVVANSVTGQTVVNPTLIPVASGVVTGSPRVFLLGGFFIVMFTNVISATSHLQYIAISTSTPTVVTANTDIAANYISATTVAWDAVVDGQKLFIAYNTTAGGQQVTFTYLTSSLAIAAPQSFAGAFATMMSLTADVTNPSNPTIYISYYHNSHGGYSGAIDQNLNTLMAPVNWAASSSAIVNVTSAAQNGTLTVFGEFTNAYSYDSGIPTNLIKKVMITPLLTPFHSIFSSGASSITASSATGLSNGMFLVDNTTSTNIASGTTITVSGTTLSLSHNTAGNSASTPGDSLMGVAESAAAVVARSVGLASKAFIINGVIYILTVYQSSLQSTYFLMDSSGNVISRFAYENAGGYLTTGLPQAQVIGTVVNIPYLYKDLISTTAVAASIPSAGNPTTTNIYSQNGINLMFINYTSATLSTSEIGSNLNLSGGMLWAYDGQTIGEQGFNLFPDSIQATWSASGGAIAAQPDGSTNTNAYYYQVIYQFTDAQGNIIQSAPSIPIGVTTTSTGTSGSITVNIPTLRLSYKQGVKIIIYRWSVANQVYYQVTSLTAPTLNDPTVDSIAYVDTLADASIDGNSILYTTGGVVEDIPGPASTATTLFDDRLWLIDAEDQNLLWYSKQVLEKTPVEMSDLFTLYIAPTTGAQGSTGAMRCLSPMDDKLIIFKKDAIYYVNGSGPDNTGANSTYSQPIFITSTVGCANQNSIVFMPNGLMFQSDKGIWLLGRDLNTTYIGAPVENFNDAVVNSAIAIPATNQVRFTLSTGVTLMYDYYYNQWGTFGNVPAISSTLYQDLHTYINIEGQVFQETPDAYLDNGNPVLLSFTTNWYKFAGLQGYQRAYFFYLLGQYLTPHKLYLQIAYDYNSAPVQATLISPDNFAPAYGSAEMPVYGQLDPYAGGAINSNSNSDVEAWRVFLQRQRCQSVQITLTEVYDPAFGVPAGQGLTLSGINLVYGVKKGFRSSSATQSVGNNSGSSR